MKPQEYYSRNFDFSLINVFARVRTDEGNDGPHDYVWMTRFSAVLETSRLLLATLSLRSNSCYLLIQVDVRVDVEQHEP